MKRVVQLSLIAASALVVSCIARPSRPGAGSLCRPPDYRSEGLIYHLRELVTTADSLMAFARDNYFHVPVVSPRRIRIVGDARICEKASGAYGPPMGSSINPRVYVVELGSKGFAVLDPDQLSGDKETVIIFDRAWVRIGGWTGP